MKMCNTRNIKYLNHSTIDPEQHLNESHLHLNKYGSIEFSKNFANFLCNLEWWGYDNSEDVSRVNSGNVSNSSSNSSFSDEIREKEVEITMSSSNLNVCDNKSVEKNCHKNPSNLIESLRQKHPNRLIIGQLKINSVRKNLTL